MSQTTFPLPSTPQQEISASQPAEVPEAAADFDWQYQGAAAKRSIRIQARIRKIRPGKPTHYEDVPSE